MLENDHTTDLVITYQPITALNPWPNNPRRHPKKQIQDIAKSIQAYGFRVPLGIDDDAIILSGHGRFEAAKLLGMTHVPCVVHSGLTDQQKRAFVIADNKTAEGSRWDQTALTIELDTIRLEDPHCNIFPTGFSLPEIETLMRKDTSQSHRTGDRKDTLPAFATLARRTSHGDVWQVGEHRIACGEASDGVTMQSLFQGVTASMVVTEPVFPDDAAPGTAKRAYLSELLAAYRPYLKAGSVALIGADWSDLNDWIATTTSTPHLLRDIIVWNKVKSSADDRLYEAGHRLILAFETTMRMAVTTDGETCGTCDTSHQISSRNSITRSNVWTYRALAESQRDADGEIIAVDPRPVQMLIDAITDLTQAGEIVFDPFAWTGTSLVAAHSAHRVAYVCENDLTYADIILTRAERVTGQKARLISQRTYHEHVRAQNEMPHAGEGA